MSESKEQAIEKDFRCQECGQFLGSYLKPHTYADCQAYKKKALEEFGYRLNPPELKLLTRRELGFATGLTLGDKVWTEFEKALQAQRDYDQSQLDADKKALAND